MKFPQSKFNIIILTSLIAHLIASYFSKGWLNADEQSCILEFVNHKLGFSSDLCFLNYNNGIVTDSSLLIRSWFQPFIYFLISKISLFLNISNFFTITFILKFISSLVGFLSIYLFYFATKDIFNKDKVKYYYLILTFLFWFYPLLHSRTSAENLSTSFFLIAISYYFFNQYKFNFWKLFLVGIFLGTTFILRYNLGISVFFFLLWIFIFEKQNLSQKLKNLIYIILGIFLLLISEHIINLWGFGEYKNIDKVNFLNLFWHLERIPSLQFFLYVNSNNFYGDPGWSQHPILGYFYLILFKFYPPISFLIIIGMIFFWIKNPKSLILWLTLPYFLIHSLIQHKELRYIYPLLVFSPFFICYFIDRLNLNKKLIKIFINFIIVLNFLGFVFFLFSSQTGDLKILNKIYNSKIQNIYYLVSEKSVENYESLNPFNIKNITTNYYFKFNQISYYQEINKIETKMREGFCQKSDCVKFEHRILKENNYYVNLELIKNKNNKKIYLKDISDKEYLEKITKKFNSFLYKYLIYTKDEYAIKLFNNNKNCNLISSKYPLFIYNLSPSRIKNQVLYECEN